MPYTELKDKACLCINHLLGMESQFNNLFCLEAIFKNYRASYAKKEVLNNQITEVNDIFKANDSFETKQTKIFNMFRKEAPLLKTINILVKLGNYKFLDFSSSLIKMMLKYFIHKGDEKDIDKLEVYRGLYINEDLLDSIDKYFVKNEYMYFNDVNL